MSQNSNFRIPVERGIVAVLLLTASFALAASTVAIKVAENANHHQAETTTTSVQHDTLNK